MANERTAEVVDVAQQKARNRKLGSKVLGALSIIRPNTLVIEAHNSLAEPRLSHPAWHSVPGVVALLGALPGVARTGGPEYRYHPSEFHPRNYAIDVFRQRDLNGDPRTTRRHVAKALFQLLFTAGAGVKH